MSERLTSIKLPGVQSSGIADWGRKTPEEMITQIRSWAANNKAIADAILAAPDEAFQVETYTGVIVQRNKTVLQEGKNDRTAD